MVTAAPPQYRRAFLSFYNCKIVVKLVRETIPNNGGITLYHKLTLMKTTAIPRTGGKTH